MTRYTANGTVNPFVTYIARSHEGRINRAAPFWGRIVAHASIPPGNTRPYPRESYARIAWSLRGDGMVPLGGREQRLRQGQFVVWLPDEPQHLRATQTEWDLAWLVLAGPLQREILQGLGFEHSAIHPAHYYPETELRHLAMTMEDETPAALLRNSRLTYDILCRIADHAIQVPDDDPIHDATTYIQAHLGDPTLSVQVVADYLEMNRSSFTRRFQRQMNQSPLQYINHHRIERAIEQLSSTSRSIGAISRECGWQDASYFARIFRKAVGVLPSALRGRRGR